MDLSTLYDHEQLFDLEITRPDTGEPIGLTIQLRSAESAMALQVERRHADELMALQRQGRDLDAATTDRMLHEKTAILVAGWQWHGDTTWKGEKPECTPAKVMEVLKGQRFILLQIRNEAADMANFTGGSQTPSAVVSRIPSATG